MAGWICVHRKIKEHWLWESEKHLKWWLDVLLSVNYAFKKVLINGKLVDCDRGQSVKSLGYWSNNWGVTKKTISSFFKLLEDDKMITVENLKVTTRLTVLNYKTYNDQVNAEETQRKRRGNAEETQTTYKQQEEQQEKQEETNNNKQEKDLDFSRIGKPILTDTDDLLLFLSKNFKNIIVNNQNKINLQKIIAKGSFDRVRDLAINAQNSSRRIDNILGFITSSIDENWALKDTF